MLRPADAAVSRCCGPGRPSTGRARLFYPACPPG
jgi:hypothetical protein